MKRTVYRIYSPAIGRPEFSGYRERLEFGTVRAESKMKALDLVAEKLGQHHIPRTQSIAVLGIGSVTVEVEDA